MNDQTDQQLLRDYAERQSEAAFAAIVHRYVDLVYSAALRLSYDAHTAKDVTQSVFVALAQNTQQLTDRPVLAGWLHTTARNLTVKTIRSDARRRVREQEAVVMNELLSANTDAGWEHVAPLLDNALSELDDTDRDAVLLRYFKNHDLRTVGATLGISDDAAQKRVSRAVERLREFFAKRGVTVGASGLAVVISANAVQAAPVGLALTISTAAALTGTTLATTATTTAIKAIAMTTLQKTIVTAAIAVLAGAGIYEARQASQLREQVQMLRKEHADETQKLQTATDETLRQLAALRDDNERLNRNSGELTKLRGQLAVFQQRQPPAAGSREKASTQNPRTTVESPSIPLIPAADWKDVGTANPSDTLQTWFWARSNQDTNAFIKTLIWDPTAKAKLDSLFAAAPESVRQKFGSAEGLIWAVAMGGHDTPMTGFGVVSGKTQGDDATLIVEHQFQDGSVRQNPITLHREDDGWRIVLDEKRLEKFAAYLSSLAAHNGKP